MYGKVSDILDDFLYENNMSVADLARALDMDHKQLSNYVKGRFIPSLRSALIIVNYFHCSLDYLAGLSNTKNLANYSEPDYLFYMRYEAYLKKRGVSHYQLTKDLKININDSRNWKTGKLPPFSNIIKIADYLGASIDEMIGREVLEVFK